MIPVRLTLSGFLSYRESITLDFTSFDLACIAGPNGAGKSSLLDAMTYALFGKARRADETVINLQSEAAFVEFVFSYESNLYRIQRTNPRGKTSVLEFQIAQPGEGGEPVEPAWKPLTERTVRDTQHRIEEVLRLDYDTFINAAFFLQGKADQFTQQTPARRKAILGSILGLEVWEGYRQQAMAKRREVESGVQAIDGRLAEIKGELSQEADRRSLLASLSEELERLAEMRLAQERVLETIQAVRARIEEQERTVRVLASQAETTRQRIDQLEQRRAARQQEREIYAETRERAEEIRDAFKELQAAREKLARWDEASREHQDRRRGPLLEIEKERLALQSEINRLEKLAGEADDMQRLLNAALETCAGLEKRVEAVNEELAGRAEIEREMEAARERLAAARAENPRLKAEMEELRSRIDQLEGAAEDAAVCPVCGQPLSAEHRAELIEELAGEGKLKGDQYRANRDLLKEADDLVGSLEVRLRDFRQADEEARRLAAELAAATAERERLEGRLGEWGQDGAVLLAEAREALDQDRYALEVRAELAAIDAALKETGYDPDEHDRIRRSVASGAQVEEAMRTLDRAAAALEPLERELGDLQKELQAANDELARQDEAHTEAAAALAAAQAEAPSLAQAQRDLLDMQEKENQLRMKVGSAQQNVEVLATLRERKARLEGEREGLSQRIARYRQLERAFGKDGVPALLIEQAIPQIEVKANELLERLSGGEMSVRFQTQRELKSRDDLRETLDIAISDGAGTRDYEMYSGGEAFRVNFAIRLALSEVLARRAGARLQTLVIDEGFGSQDEIGRQRLVEAINEVREDFEKILVITHIESLKDAFPTRIEVAKGADGSSLSVLSG